MSTYIVSPSTSVVLLDTSVLAGGASAVVLLSSLMPPGRIITIRDTLGYLSSPQSIIVSTTQNLTFADGTSSLQISQPFATLSFSSRDPNTWNIINTFGFPLYDTVANVASITANTFSGSTLITTGSISTGSITGNSLYLTSSSQILGPAFISSLVVGTPSTTGYAATIVGSTYISSNVSIGGNVSVGGAGSFSSIGVVGAATIGGGATIGGTITVQGNFQTLGQGLMTCGSAAIQSSLTVVGSAIFNSNLTATGLAVGGATTLTTLGTSSLQINSGGSLQFTTGPTLQAVGGVASWTSPLYTPYLSTGTLQTSGLARIGTLQIASTISAPTLSQFLMSSTAIQNPGGNLTISSVATNSLTLSNSLTTPLLQTTSLTLSTLNASQITSGSLSTGVIYTSTLASALISTGSLQTGIIQTPAVSVSSLTVAQSIVGGPGFSTLNLSSAILQNPGGSLFTGSLYTTALTTSTLVLSSGLLQATSTMTLQAPSVVMNALSVSSITTSTLQVSSLSAVQMTIGAPTTGNGPTLAPVATSNVSVAGGPGDYLTPYILSNVLPPGQNPLVPYTASATYTAQTPGVLPPGLVIGYTATLFWAGQSASFVNLNNGAAYLYGTYNSDQTISGTVTTSSFQLQATLYGNSAISVNFGYQYSPNFNSIDSNAVVEFNNGILHWNYALNGTTIQNSLNDISTRNLYYYGGLQFASDPRLKEKVEDADLRRCYETIKSLPLRRYKYIDSYCSTFQVHDKSRLGFLATDLLPHFPKSVQVSDTIYPEFSKSLMTIDTSQIEMAHLGATKYLMEEIARLEALIK